jgi:hypothetical protein
VIGNLHFNVKSVINPQEPPSEPFGPRGPIDFGMPTIYWVSIIFVVTAMIALIVGKIISFNKRKQRLAELTLHIQGKTPFIYFSTLVRKLNRQHLFLSDANQKISAKDMDSFLTELENGYRIYLGTQFKIETNHLKDLKICRLVSKKISTGLEQLEIMNEMIKIFNEFARARQSEKKMISAKDGLQVFEQIKKNVDILNSKMDKKEKRATS